MRASLLQAISLVALTGGGAFAQSSGAEPAPVPAADAPAWATSEIVVTARRRAEGLQDTPIAVSAFNAAALERQQINDVADLSLAAPSVLITQTGGSANAAQIFIRGFGQDALGFNSETPVAIYFDDVYLGRVQGSLLDIMDVERVEILRGPQGSLYGRNSTTGAVKFVIRAPDLDAARFAAEVTAGSFDRLDVRGTMSVPLVEGRLAAKVDFSSRNSDGYLKGVDSSGELNGLETNGANRDVVRAAIAYQASDRVYLEFAGDLSRDRSGSLTSTPITCAAGADSECEPTFGSAYRAGLNYPGLQESDAWGLSAKATVELEDLELRSITAYRGFDGLDPIDLLALPGIPLPITYGQNQNQFSQELQLLSTGDGPLSFVAGLFYFRENWETDTQFLGARRNIDEQDASSIGVFGELYYDLTDTLSVTLGGRLTRDKKTIERQIFIPPAAAAATVSVEPEDYKETVFTPKVGLDWEPSENLLIYAIYAQGYRPGGYADTWPSNALAAAGSFDAEKVDSYEIGAKTSWLDDRITLNLAAYQADYNNLQQGLLTSTEFFITSSDVRVRGLELEASVRPTQNLLLYGNFGLLDDEIKSSTIPGDDLSRRLRYAPKTTFKIGGEFDIPVTSAGDSLFVAANLAWVGRTPMDQTNTLSLFMPSYELLDAQVGFREATGRYRVAVGSRNLTDTEYWRSGIPGLGRFYAAPRTWFVTLSSQF